MGRNKLQDPKNRRKGPAGTGASRKRERRIRQRGAKDRHDQLVELHEKQKKKLKSLGKDGEKNAGFTKALMPEVVAATVPFVTHFWQGPEPCEPDDALKMRRKELGVKVRGSFAPAPVDSFTDGSLPRVFSEFFNAQRGSSGSTRRIEKPTPIQAQVWPAALCGLDVIGIAPTGTGKTLAYLLPAVQHTLGQKVEKERISPVCLTLVPTRELARQVIEMCCASTSSGGWLKRLFALRAGAIYGGIEKDEQLDALITSGAPHLLCATPGRLLDLVGLGALSLSSVSYLVLDEADRMLALGFEPQLTAVIKAIRPNRQALLFSATFPGKLREAAESWMAQERVLIRVATMDIGDNEPEDATERSTFEPGDSTSMLTPCAAEDLRDETGPVLRQPSSSASALTISPTIHQVVHVCAQHKKQRKLLLFFQKVRADEQSQGIRQRSAVIVFCSQIKVLRTVAAVLAQHGERCASLHSGIPQAKREQALVDLKCGRIDTIVATDVASRGIHISRLRHVVNYDFPSNLETYCHRIGRVGRQGVKGFSYSFFTRNLAPLAAGLVAIMERCNQRVDPNLRSLAEGGKDSTGGDEADDDEEEAEGEDAESRTEEDADSARHDVKNEEVEDADEPAPRGIGRGGGICIQPRKRRRDASESSNHDASGAEPIATPATRGGKKVGKKRPPKKKRRQFAALAKK